MTAEVSFTYPTAGATRYPAEYEAVARVFTPMLWAPDRLPEIVHPVVFVQRDQDGTVSLDGVEELQAYRRRFGDLTLVKVTMIAVPPEMVMLVPGPEGGMPYDLDKFFEAVFLLPVDGPLPPGAPEFPPGTPPALIVIRMREPERYLWGLDPSGRRKLMVAGRSYDPAGEVTMLPPGGQHDFVVRQLWYYWRSLRDGRTPVSMYEAAIMRPLAEIMRDELPAAFAPTG